MDKRPIGIFDSGLGGLTVVKEVKKLLPNEKILYLGDIARIPYGTRSNQIIKRFSLQNAFFLEKQGVKCIIIACNTSSAIAHSYIKRKVSIPVFDMITAGLNGIVGLSNTTSIGVIGTKATINSNAYSKRIKKTNPKIDVTEVACPLFVSLVEEDELKGELIELLAKKYLSVFDKKKIDTLILGCTHFPLIEKVIQSVIGKDVRLINTGKELARFLEKYLTINGLKSDSKSNPVDTYFVTDLTDNFVKVAERFLGDQVKGKMKKVELE